MTLDDRIEIKGCLYRGITIKVISRRVGKASAADSKQVKPHGMSYKSGHTRIDECCQRKGKNMTRTFFDLAYADGSPSQTLDLYLPNEHQTPCPLIVFAHGGAFTFDDKRDE